MPLSAMAVFLGDAGLWLYYISNLVRKEGWILEPDYQWQPDVFCDIAHQVTAFQGKITFEDDQLQVTL